MNGSSGRDAAQWPNQPRAAAAVGIQGRKFGMGSGVSNGGNDSNGNSCGWSSSGGSPSVNFDDLPSECSFVCFFCFVVFSEFSTCTEASKFLCAFLAQDLRSVSARVDQFCACSGGEVSPLVAAAAAMATM